MKAFLMIGQSNMAGRGEIGQLPPVINEHVLALRGEAWIPAREPVNPDRVFAGESLQITFADRVQKALGGEIGLIPCAEGGTLLHQWAPGSELFERAVRQAKIAMQTAELSGILWIQGENDGYSEANALAHKGKFLTMLTKAIASRYAKDGIRCNSVHPSTVDTPLVQTLFKDPARKAERLGEVPLGRLAQASDVSNAVLYLCSDEASFLNGVALPVDGGVTCY